MGKSNRGKSEAAMRKYGDPAYEASAGMAGQAGNIYYGGPSQPPTRQAQPRGGGRTRRPDPQATTGGTTGGDTNYQQTFQQIFPEGSLSPDQLVAKEGELNKAGIEVLRNAAGVAGKIKLPDGTVVDVIQGAMSGGNTKQWLTGGGGQPGGQQQGGVAGQAIADYGEILNRYRQFADTGGYSPEDIGAIRSRAVSPIRSVYSDVNRSIDRSRSLQGDYAPGYAATKAKVGREQAYTTADATTNVEAALAQMIQQGKLAGMGGMSNLYGTTPGMANMFGNQALQSQGMMNQMGMGMMGAQNQALQQPGMFDTIMGGAGRVGGMIFPWADRFGPGRDK